MEIYAANFTLQLVEADVVESLKTRSADRPDTVIRDKEMLLPSHKDILSLGELWNI